MFDVNLLKEGLNLSTIQLQVKIFKELDSTNVEAKRQIVDGNKQDLLIVSSHQTAGRGRLSRSWFSPIGGLYFSLVLNLDWVLNLHLLLVFFQDVLLLKDFNPLELTMCD